MEEKNTTNQVKKAPNPTGKGGFGDNPQNRSDGRWSKEQSQSYWMNYFLRLSVTDFEKYKKDKPKELRTIAEQLAFNRVAESINELKSYEIVANRTEGKPKESHEISGKDGGPIEITKVEWVIDRGDGDESRLIEDES